MKPEPIVITLETEEIRLANYLARRRVEENKRIPMKNKGVNTTRDMTRIEIENMSIEGEIAIAKLCNLYPPMSQNPAEIRSQRRGSNTPGPPLPTS